MSTHKLKDPFYPADLESALQKFKPRFVVARYVGQVMVEAALCNTKRAADQQYHKISKKRGRTEAFEAPSVQ